jgi:transposase-like protein
MFFGKSSSIDGGKARMAECARQFKRETPKNQQITPAKWENVQKFTKFIASIRVYLLKANLSNDI